VRRLMAPVAVAACLFAASCSRPDPPSEITVQIVAATAADDGGAYAPKTVRARPGAVVAWAALDRRLHTVTATDAAFASPHLHRGDSFRLRFNQTGTYAYFCVFHHGMTGSVVIE
jgi:plastocyanin